MNTKTARQLTPHQTVYVTGLFNRDIETTVNRIEGGMVIVNTSGDLDARRTQIDIDAGVHELALQPRFITLEASIHHTRDNFDRPIGGYRKW